MSVTWTCYTMHYLITCLTSLIQIHHHKFDQQQKNKLMLIIESGKHKCIMSQQITSSKNSIPKPSINSILQQSKNNPFNRSKKFSNWICNNSSYLEKNRHILCEGGSKNLMYDCETCKTKTWHWSACNSRINFYANTKSAHRHKRDCHKKKSKFWKIMLAWNRKSIIVMMMIHRFT